MIFVLLTSLESLCLHFEELGSKNLDTIYFVVFYILSIIATVYASDLLIMHIGMIYKGVTTVESLRIENDPDNQEYKKNKQETLQETLGTNLLTWLFPTSRSSL